jgi:hypothetical protein
MLRNKEHYEYPIGAIRHHFKEFHVWMAFFVVINGGLLVAYTAKELKPCVEMSILFSGYAATLLFHCSSKRFQKCITEFSNLIDGLDKQNAQYFSLPY